MNLTEATILKAAIKDIVNGNGMQAAQKLNGLLVMDGHDMVRVPAWKNKAPRKTRAKRPAATAAQAPLNGTEAD